VRVWEKGVPSPGSASKKIGFDCLIFGGFFKCQEFALVKAAEGGSFARTPDYHRHFCGSECKNAASENVYKP
jgi:hypothetical protein